MALTATRTGSVNGRSPFVNGRHKWGPYGYDINDRVFIPPNLSGPIDEHLVTPVKIGTALLGSAVGAALAAALLSGKSRFWATLGSAVGAVAGGTASSLIGNHFITYTRVAATDVSVVEDVADVAEDLEG